LLLTLSQDKKHLKNVGPIRHSEPPHAALPFTRCRYCRTHAACASMSTTTTTTTTRDRGDRYGPREWAQRQSENSNLRGSDACQRSFRIYIRMQIIEESNQLFVVPRRISCQYFIQIRCSRDQQTNSLNYRNADSLQNRPDGHTPWAPLTPLTSSQ